MPYKRQLEGCDFTFVKGATKATQAQNAPFKSVDDIELALVDDIGQATYNKVYPILIDFGDKILYETNRPNLEKKLNHLLPKEKINQYYGVFTIIIFQAMTAKDAGGGEKGLLSANQTLKNIDATATF